MSRSATWSTTTRVALWLLAAFAMASIVIPSIAPVDPLAIEGVVDARLLAPLSRDAAGHLHALGTDRFGRDVLVRMFLAGRISLAVGVGGSILATIVGVVIGALAGWWRGGFDRVAMSVGDALLAIPRLILLLLVASLWSPGLTTVVTVLALTGWMSVARLVRAEVMTVARQPFVDAARALGMTELRTLARHVVPNALTPAIVATTLGVGNAILLESGLAFLGLGVQPPTPSWGNMIAGGRDLIVTAPWVALAPGLALIGTVLLCTVIGDAFRTQLAGRAGVSLSERT